MRLGINGTGIVQKASVDAIADHAKTAALDGFSSYWLAEHPTGGLDAMMVLTIVGLRDYCHQEADLIASDNRINAFTDRGMNKALFAGQTWTQVCRSVVNTLPDHVYLSVDIDGFDPSLCPSTGTPVPGGLSIAQFTYLLDAVITSGRKIIGGDLVEVVPGKGQWDANVGARVLSAISHRLA